MDIKLVKEIIKKWEENSSKSHKRVKDRQEEERKKSDFYQPREWLEGYYEGLAEAYKTVLELIEEESK